MQLSTKPCVLFLAPHKAVALAQCLNFHPQEVETGGPDVHGHLHLHKELQSSLGYVEFYLKAEEGDKKKKLMSL